MKAKLTKNNMDLGNVLKLSKNGHVIGYHTRIILSYQNVEPK